MNISSKQGREMPVSRNSSSYAGENGDDQKIHHQPPSQNHIIHSSTVQPPSQCPISPSLQEEHHHPYKKVVTRYRECLKNHAAAIGGNATDGCGEFMPSGEEGTLEALKCSACNCHRNFHRKEIEGDQCSSECYRSPLLLNNGARKLILGHHKGMVGPELLGYPTGTLIRGSYKRSAGFIPSESDEQDGGVGVVARPGLVVKKRFRTKFTLEQKNKMLEFAEKAGWRIQRLEESVVQQFCQEIGIKRRVLKVWMHNNKHNLADQKNSTC